MRLNDGRVLPAFMSQALEGRPMTVFGDGSQTRSFCYVDDLVEGIWRLLNSDEVEPTNIGNPNEMTIMQFAEKVRELTGSRSEMIFKELPVDDPKVRQPCIDKAKRVLGGWEPQIDLDTGLRRTMAFFQERVAKS
jgi:dTDP-glucose 4,6-dehydratase